MYEIVNSNLLIREWLNGSLLPLTLNLSIVIGVYLFHSVSDARRSNTRLSDVPGVKTAHVLFWIFLAESIRAGSVWFSLRAQNSGKAVPPHVQDVLDMLLVVCVVVLMAAVLRCTYIFSPPQIRGIFWIYSLTATIMFVLLSHMFPQYPAFF